MKEYESFEFELQNPFTMCIAGPTKSGKTTFVGNLLKSAHLIFTKTPNKVFYFYNQCEPEDANLQNCVYEFIKGLPSENWVTETYDTYGPNTTIVIDDQALHINKVIAELFTVNSSRQKCNVIYITQNLFSRKDEAREISLNCSYFVLFKNPRDSLTVQSFFKQYDPGNSKILLEIYQEATEKPYSYLFIDLHQRTLKENRLLSNIFEENNNPPMLYRY